MNDIIIGASKTDYKIKLPPLLEVQHHNST